MGGGAWVDTFYSRREHARREKEFNKSNPEFNKKKPDHQPSEDNPRTRFDRILNTEEEPLVSSKSSTSLIGSTRFDRILRDNEG
jgi:hypothetical protein